MGAFRSNRLAAIAFVVLLATAKAAFGDFVYVPSDEAAKRLTLAEAQMIFREFLLGLCMTPPCPVEFAREYVQTDYRNPKRPKGDSLSRITYRDISRLELRYVSPRSGFEGQLDLLIFPRKSYQRNLHPASSYRDEEKAKLVVDALRRLHIEWQEADRKRQDAEATAEAVFQEEMKRFQVANPNPELPEEARRFKVQAEAAIRDKRFADAAERYAEALKLAPWWPDGRFNRALVLGELKFYDSAMREMKRYLLLVPDAPDARAAQDKIYEWEGSVGRK